MPNCFVRICKNSDRRRPPGVTFHKIPKKLAREWLKAVQRPVNTLVINQRVCSEHFHESDFNNYGRLKSLKENVVPSLRLPASVGELIHGGNAATLKEERIAELFQVEDESGFSKPEVVVQKSLTIENGPSSSEGGESLSVSFKHDINGEGPDELTSLKRKRAMIAEIHNYCHSPRKYQNKLNTALHISHQRKWLQTCVKRSSFLQQLWDTSTNHQSKKINEKNMLRSNPTA